MNAGFEARRLGLLTAGAFALALFGCDGDDARTEGEKQAVAERRQPAAARDAGSKDTTGEQPAATAKESLPAGPASAASLSTAESGERQATKPAVPEQSAATPSSSPDLDGPTDLRLEGVIMKVPEGWIARQGGTGPMAPKAVYLLPKAQGDDQDASVRITHFPRMKGMDDANINRWISQVKRSDGSSATRDDATITKLSLGSVDLTFVEIDGTVSTDMRMTGGASGPNQTMIAAIVDHPGGPHFVRAIGLQATVSKWRDSILAFFKSATVD